MSYKTVLIAWAIFLVIWFTILIGWAVWLMNH